jgi:hypothetical protein
MITEEVCTGRPHIRFSNVDGLLSAPGELHDTLAYFVILVDHPKDFLFFSDFILDSVGFLFLVRQLNPNIHKVFLISCQQTRLEIV